jgi:Hemerythrin HHE cation binding domain
MPDHGHDLVPGGAVRGGPTSRVPRGLGVVPTPDDGTRLSARRVWEESTRPTGPAVPEESTYTVAQRESAQHLVDVHDHLRAELAQIRDLVRQVAAGAVDVGAARSAIGVMTMRQNNWTLGAYCASYCRVVTMHHTLEDRSMLPHLRAADPRLAPVVDRLQQEHRVIHEVLNRVDAALVALVRPDDNGGQGMQQLQHAVDLLTDTLLSHLSYEERELVEPLARVGMW